MNLQVILVRRESETKKILLVDDSANERSLVRNALEATGFVCVEAAGGIDGLRMARNAKPDLVLLDLAMPGMNGYDVAMVLRREMPTVPVVMLTMYGGQIGTKLADSFGVKAVLDKAEGLGPLLACVKSLLDSPAAGFRGETL